MYPGAARDGGSRHLARYLMPRVVRQNSESFVKSARSASLTKKILPKLCRSGYFAGTLVEAGTRPVDAIAFWPSCDMSHSRRSFAPFGFFGLFDRAIAWTSVMIGSVFAQSIGLFSSYFSCARRWPFEDRVTANSPAARRFAMSVWPLRSDGLFAAMHLSVLCASASPRILRSAEYTTTSDCSTAILPESAGLQRSFQVLTVTPAGILVVLMPGRSLLKRAAIHAPSAALASVGKSAADAVTYFCV